MRQSKEFSILSIFFVVASIAPICAQSAQIIDAFELYIQQESLDGVWNLKPLMGVGSTSFVADN